MGIEGMAVAEMDTAYYFGEDAVSMNDVDYGGYYFLFMRTFGGMTSQYISNFMASSHDQYDVTPPVDMESLAVAINDSGEVESFVWQNPAEITGSLTEHVDILSFEEIMERLKTFTHLKYSYESTTRKDGLLWVKNIYKIGLYLNYLPLEDNPDEFMFVPCWFFTYKDGVEYTDEQLAALKSSGISPICSDSLSDGYFIFSAVDGSSVSAYSSKMLDEMMGIRTEAGDAAIIAIK